MPKIVIFCNNKGGCGKTTLAYQVAIHAALAGVRVLAIDTDPQANLTATIAGVIKAEHKHKREKLVSTICDRLHCVFSADDASAVSEAGDGQYDLVIIDTAPSPVPPEGCKPHVLVIPYNGIYAASGVSRMERWANMVGAATLLVEVQNNVRNFNRKARASMNTVLKGRKPVAVIKRSDGIANNPMLPVSQLRGRGAQQRAAPYLAVLRAVTEASL